MVHYAASKIAGKSHTRLVTYILSGLRYVNYFKENIHQTLYTYFDTGRCQRLTIAISDDVQ